MNVHIDLRPSLNGVLYQGKRMSCLAFATSSAHGQKTPMDEDLSVEYLFYHAVQNMPNADPDKGTTIDAMALALQAQGQPEEHVWPYANAQAYGADWVPPSHGAAVYKASLRQDTVSVGRIIEHLDEGHSVVLGLIVTDAFYTCCKDGRLPKRDPDIQRASHAVLAVGHASDARNQYILIRNSWGVGWGLHGHAWLSGAYLQQHLAEMATIS